MVAGKHGISIGISRVDNQFFFSLKAAGKLTHEDYKVITPMIESALAGVQTPIVNALIDATEFEGWELRAAWDDLKLGLKHSSEFNKVAIYGCENWQNVLAKIGSWFIAGEVKYFEKMSDAVDWLTH